MNWQKGFTLIEISIVLLIIALLTGAVLQGSEMIRSAELRSMITKVEEHKSAISQFQELYEALPGDMTNATDYWSASANGDGDTTIDIETSNEPFRALEQLYLAELIEGSYNGAWGSGFAIGSNIGELSRSGVSIYAKCCSTTDYARTLDFNNHINIFTVYSDDDDFRAGAVSPIEAQNIDDKIDDGIPDFGFVGSSGSYTGLAYAATGCYSGTGSTSTYLTANATYKDADGCQMLFAYDWD